MQHRIEEAACELAEARRMIDAVRAALEARPDDPRLGAVASEPERITAEVGMAGGESDAAGEDRGMPGIALTIVLFAFQHQAVAQPVRLNEAELTRGIRNRLDGAEATVWLGGLSGPAWFQIDADRPRPSASAIKTFYLVELFDAYSKALDQPLPGTHSILKDDHPAISHFAPEVRDEIRKELGGATVRKVGEVMMGTAKASNAVYNAAANLVTAALGGPEALTDRIRKRDPAFAAVAVRRYMLRDRKASGDNEVSGAALAAIHQRLATRRLAGVDEETMESIRKAMLQKQNASLGSHHYKHGSLASDPLTEVRAGWWDTKDGPVVYVAMLSQEAPGSKGRQASSESLARSADAIGESLVLAAQAARR